MVAGLISLIPVAGFMNLYGWALTTADNLRAGYPVPAPGNLDHMGRGVRYVGWGCLVGALNFALTIVVGAGAALIAFKVSGQLAWTIAIGLVAAWTWLNVTGLVLRPLTLPVLQLCERDGFVAALKPARVWRELRMHWDAAWYGVLALVVWTLAYTAGYMVVSLIPFVGGFGVFAVMIPANGVLGLLLAAALARYDDAPSTFQRAHTNGLAAVLTAMTVIGIAFAWIVALVAANVVAGHPEETACFFAAGCHFQYSGSRETIARFSRDSSDRSLLHARVTFINSASHADNVEPSEYAIGPTQQRSNESGPSSDCPTPAQLTVSARSRATQDVCFRLPDETAEYDVHLPWTGWIVNAAPSTD
jgi:hypothetical protein